MTLNSLEKILYRFGPTGVSPGESAATFETLVKHFSQLQPNFEVSGQLWRIAMGTGEVHAVDASTARVTPLVLRYAHLTTLPSVFGGVLLFRHEEWFLVVPVTNVRLTPSSHAPQGS